MRHVSVTTFPLILLAALAVSTAGAAEEPSASDDPATTERHLYLYDGSGLPTWLPESMVDLDPAQVVHMDMYEVTRMPRQFQPTAEQQAAADSLVAAAHEAAERNGWHDFGQATADGYQVMEGDTAHYANREFLQDGKVLDVDRPEFLMYYDTDSGKRLAGLMFLVEEHLGEGPQVGGPLTRWHFHIWKQAKCLLHGLLVVGDADENGECAEGVVSHRSPEMMHLWLIDHPDGPFATKMHLEAWQMRELEGDHHHHH